MIKALLLIFLPGPTWEQIQSVQRKWATILLGYFVPFLLLVSALEGFALVKWGTPRGEVARIVKFSISQAMIFEIFQIILTLATVIVLARIIKALGETFHGRHTFRQSFTVAAYGLSPVLLLRIMDMFPRMSPWATWAIGVVLAITILYQGLPVVMQPDPPHAFGLYLMSSFLLIFVSGLARFLTAWYLMGKFTKLDELVSQITSHLSF